MLRGRWSRALSISGAILALSLAGFLYREFRPIDPLRAGQQAYDRGDWKGADLKAREVLKARPGDRDALRIIARSSARLGKDELAESAYRTLGTGPMEAEDLFLLGRGLLRRGQSGPALAAFGAARDADPDHSETLDLLVRYWEEKGSWFEAAEAAGRLSRRPGWEVIGNLGLGRLLDRLNDPAGSASALEEALKRDPALTGSGVEPDEARQLLAWSLLASNRPVEAGRAIRSSDPEANWLRSRVLLQLGRTREAEAALRLAGDPELRDPLKREPSPFVGSMACARCHRTKSEARESSRHASTLIKGQDLAAIPWPGALRDEASNVEVSHELRRSGDRVEATTRVGSRELRATVEYAMGSNHQGQSFLAREEGGRVRELRISRYPDEPRWARTIEHPDQPPDEGGYLGRSLSPSSVLLCLDCHSTDFRAVTEPRGRPEAADRGIGCERCHGPGANHLKAVDLHFSDPAIARPRLASASGVMSICGQCHKAPGSVSPDDPKFIRFQTPNIERSRCYTESDGGLSCVTCHDPHVDAVRSSSHYEAKCLSCHTANREPATSTVCRVNPIDHCLDCHMPRVTDAVPRSVFTDHFIRIRKPSGPPGLR